MNTRFSLVNRFFLNGGSDTITCEHCMVAKQIIEEIRIHHGYAPSFLADLFKKSSHQPCWLSY
jgi:hypothetical protein